MQVMPPLHRYLVRPEAPPPFRITDRDIHEILDITAYHRFVSSAQYERYCSGSEQVIQKRCKLLFWHGFLDKPPAQHLQLASFYNPSHVYALGRRGAKLLRELNYGNINDRLDWRAKNNRATAPFMAHTLGVTEFGIDLRLACRNPGAPTLLDHFDLLPLFPAATGDHDPFSLQVKVAQKTAEPLTLTVVPDRLFSLAFANNTRLNFAFEFDTGSMPITAKRPTQRSTYAKKILGYWHAWLQRRHTERWNFQSFRILTLTTSEQRIGNMLTAQRTITGDAASNLFLYTTAERLAQHGALGPAWCSSKRDRIALTE